MLVLPLLIATLAHQREAAQPTEIVLNPTVAEVAVFKPGLVYVVREATVPAGLHQCRLNRVPQAMDGTMWYSSPDGAKLSEIQTTLDLQSPAGKRDLVSIPQILAASVGRTIEFTLKGERVLADHRIIKGKVISIDPQGTVTVRLPNGHLRPITLYEIIEIDGTGLPTQVDRQVPKVALRFRVEASQPSRIRIVSLETGAAWVANYRLDVAGDSGHLESAAQLGLAGLSLKGTHVRLVSGLPNLKPSTRLDMSAGSGSLSSFLDNQSGSMAQTAIDPYDLAERMIRSASAPVFTPQYGGGGGFGGGGIGGGGQGPVPNGVDFISYDPSDNSLVVKNDSNVPQFLRTAISAARVEDLHTYEYGTVTLPPGGRITRILSDQDVPLTTIYRWSVSPATNFEHVLRLHNSSKAGWPNGLIFLQNNGIPLAQVEMPFTAPDQDADLVLGNAEDLLHSVNVRELERKPIVIPKRDNPISVLSETTIEVTNTRPESVETEITYDVIGAVADAAGATVTKIPKLDPFNPESYLTWHLHLAAGERKSIVVKFWTVVA
ncbi:hypothetical protein [Fimbriimonas ginsengisoli]|uniref:DUF4139 domain-containing protein n=1 Tax=Fimbriimonas ginsengisoli Gsoil 348 TaxID=661478 RepID=A0A068NYL9_FIMGI|nr:hypothetical protein [Fimbriimonas ginsengisoli]AIE87054.1 hypothetical protein OP10G_3686 [Fimbriimonas ginsengisoli Gsoil 348]